MTTEENRKLLLDTYKDLQKKGNLFVESLYIYDCLRLSGFEEAEALDLIDTLRSLYLKDESGASIGRLSDNLYNYVKDKEIDIKNKTSREVLSDIDFWIEDDEYEDF
ncbi:MAG: hypothetical protein J6T15_03860 [Bacilli bacterium]|nr:hypothetical protein [Bacilli bacterium]